jgi:hypothetical protein
LDGFDPYSEFWKSGDTLTNFITGDSVKLETGSLLWGSYSGNNSDHLKSFADHFSTSGDKQVLGVILNVINNTRTSNASLTLRIWKNLDQEGILYQKEIPLTDLVAGAYNFVGFDTAVYAGNDFFAGFELNYAIPGDTSSFAVGMAASRNQTAVNTAWVSDGVTWKTLADYTGNQVNSSFAIFPVVYDSIPQTKGPLFTDDLMIYPNPAKNRINVFFNEIVDTPVQISIYNNQGGLVKSLKYGAYQHNFQIELPAMVPGIYLVQLNFAHTNRIVKLSIVK